MYPPRDPTRTHVVCSGLFEYMRRPEEFLRNISGLAPEIILSYNQLKVGDSKLERMTHHWCNHYSEQDLLRLFLSLGLEAEEIARLPSTEIIYRISRSREPAVTIRTVD